MSRYIFGCLFFIFTSMLQCKNITETSVSKKKYSMKILMVVNRFPQLSETFIINQIIGLLDRGHDVKILAVKGQGDMTKVQPEVFTHSLLQRVYYNSRPISYDSFDVIICQFGPLGNAFALLKQNKKMHTKLVTCFRGHDLSVVIRRFKNRYATLFNYGDLFFPVANVFKERLINLGCDSQKIIVLHSTINCKKFRFRKRKFPVDGIIRIISTGRLIEKKGFAYAIRAVARVFKSHPNIRYTIIGSGKLEQSLRSLIKELQAETYITLAGAMTSDGVRACLDNAHIFILPSVTAANGDQEGIANALKEALAMGLPVIATHHSGTPELVDDGKSGYLVPERDVDALSEKINELIRRPEQWESMGYNGRCKVEQEFEIEKENDHLERLLLRFIGKNDAV